jgi:hypothetical protein
VVQHATAFVWMYPADQTKNKDMDVSKFLLAKSLKDMDVSKLRDYSLLVYGGFMYLDSTDAVVGANGIVCGIPEQVIST